MSALVAVVSLGTTGRAEGALKVTHVVGHLYVGRVGQWIFHRLGETGRCESMTVQSFGYSSFWHELATGFELLTRDDEEVRVPSEVEELSMSAAEIAGHLNVAAVVSVLEPGAVEAIKDLSAIPGWSVEVTAPVFERKYSRWRP